MSAFDQVPGGVQVQPIPGRSAVAGGKDFALASWGQRVGASLLDAVFTLPFIIVFFVAFGASGIFSANQTDTDFYTGQTVNSGSVNINAGVLALAGVVYLLLIVFQIWQLYLQGKTGSTWGKKIVGIAVIKEQNAAPTGFWFGVGRQIMHVIDSLIFYIGYLFPIWDLKGQTLADKIVGTVVVRTK